MFNYSKITNPFNHKIININSKNGNAILNKYLNYLQTGGISCSVCGAVGTNCSTCPHNTKLTKQRRMVLSKKSGKHNKTPIIVTKAKAKAKTGIKTSSKTITLANGVTIYRDILTKARNKLREDERIAFIVNSINSPDSQFGKRLRSRYNTNKPANLKMVSATHLKCGGCGTHYDFKIFTQDDTILNCEEKGTENRTATLVKNKPWSNSVQAVNIILKGLRFSERYASLYFKFIQTLGVQYNVDLSNFTFKMFSTDFFRSNSVKTSEMIAIKGAFSKIHGAKTPIQRAYINEVHALNKEFVKTVTDTEKQEFIQHAQIKINKAFSDKDCWLQTAGLTLSRDIYDVEGRFDFMDSAKTCNFMWSPRIAPPIITDIILDAVISGTSAQLYLTYVQQGIPTKSTRTSIRLRNKFANCSTDYK